MVTYYTQAREWIKDSAPQHNYLEMNNLEIEKTVEVAVVETVSKLKTALEKMKSLEAEYGPEGLKLIKNAEANLEQVERYLGAFRNCVESFNGIKR